MSIISGALAMGRRAAEARMTETVEVFERVETQNPTTLKTETTDTVEWTGPARLYISDNATSVREQGGQIVLATRRELHVPVSTPRIVPGRYARITASATDPSLAGRVLRVSSRPESGQTTAHRYEVTETSAT